MGYPQIQYPADFPTATLAFTFPPVKKPGPWPVTDQESVGVASVTLSGLRQVMYYRTDEFVRLTIEAVPWADMADWQSFIQYAIQGGSFLYYPDASDLSTFGEYWLEDAGGPGRSSSSGSSSVQTLLAWGPAWVAFLLSQFELILRKVPSP